MVIVVPSPLIFILELAFVLFIGFIFALAAYNNVKWAKKSSENI